MIINDIKELDPYRNLKNKDIKDIKVTFTCISCNKEKTVNISSLLKKDSLVCGNCSQKIKLKKHISENKDEWVNRWKTSVYNKYGVSNISQCKEVQDNKKLTCLEKYGTEYAIASKEVREKINSTFEEKYNSHSAFSSKDVQEKSKKTMLERYGVEYAAQNKQIYSKVKNTNVIKYGSECSASNNIVKERKYDTNLKKYGEKEYFKTEEFKNKRQSTMIDKYGVEYPSQNDEIKQKIRDSGGFYNANRLKSYVYDNLNFDSSYELAYYIYLKDHNIPFEYQPNLFFTYLDENNIEHRYFPDFLIENQLYEIKGDQFFNKSGEPYNCYNKKYWWEKYNLIINNNIKILREKDIEPYIKYVSDNYGKHFLKSCKRKRN